MHTEDAKYFSVIADSMPDTFHLEKAVFILHYVQLNNKNKYEVFERFLVS